MPDISLFEAIRTQRAIRKFKTDPVPDEVIHTILEAAIRAPNGGNQQRWHFLVIRDRDTKGRLGEWYRDALNARTAEMEPAMAARQPYRPDTQEMLTDHMEDVPVLILACVRHRSLRSNDPGNPINRGGEASIYPAVQNILLAARALGLGSVLTTSHFAYEKEIKEFLGIPEDIDTAALIPLGYPAEGVSFGGSRRRPVSRVTSYDRWGQPAPS